MLGNILKFINKCFSKHPQFFRRVFDELLMMGCRFWRTEASVLTHSTNVNCTPLAYEHTRRVVVTLDPAMTSAGAWCEGGWEDPVLQIRRLTFRVVGEFITS